VEAIRYGGYRPVVFMTHGLAVGMWMVVATLAAWWLWRSKSLASLGGWRLPMSWAVGLLAVTTVLVKSTGALALGIVGAAALYQTRWWRWPVFFLVLLVIAPLYISTRATGVWSGTGFVNLVKTRLDEDRAASMAFRFENEDLLLARALQKPAFGWGDTGLGRQVARRKKTDKPEAVTDGFWIIVLGNYGVIGLTAVYAMMLLPALRFAWTYSPRLWSQPALAAGAVTAVILILYMIDNLANAMFQPVFVLMAGGLASVVGVKASQPAPRQPMPERRVPARQEPQALPPGVLSRPRPMPR
jgi:hypothetical protein